MAWQTLRYKLTSSAPLIPHNGQTADPLNKFSKAIKLVSTKRAKTDADYEELARLEFLSGLYLDTNGPIVPNYAIESMVLHSAQKMREGQLAKSGCFCLEHAQLEYEGPRLPDALWADESFRFSAIVRVGPSRIVRTRPIFREWSCTVVLSVEDAVVNPPRVDDWLQIGGTQIGLGDWRPQYGRFSVEKIGK